MRKLISTLFATALLLSPHFFLSVSEVQASTRARGTVRAVDLAASTVTLALRNDDSLTLNVDERTEITRNGSPATLADLERGDKATAYYDSTTLIAERIEARGEERPSLARVEGVVAAVNTESKKVTINPIRGEPVTLGVTEATEIALDGRPARLGDLQRGFAVAASFNPATLEAVRIDAQSFAEVRGVVRDVSVPNQTLTIAKSNDEAITLGVPPNTPISLNDRPASLGDLRRGYRVVAAYLLGSLQAVRIAAISLNEVSGHIRSVDVDASTVVITPLVEGPAVELHVTNSTQITIGGERATIDRLRAGMEARAVYNLASFEAVEIAARPLPDDCTLVHAAGTIRAVGDNTVTIGLGEGAGRITLNVVERTEITLNGRPARLSELRAGMRAEAAFCRETMVAQSIAAVTPSTRP